MSCCESGELREQKLMSESIDKVLIEHRKQSSREFKLLLLGSGGSGKSTFLKQMKIIHGSGYSAVERKQFVRLVHQNILTAVQSIIQAMTKLDISFNNPALRSLADELMSVKCDSLCQLGLRNAQIISYLWKDSGFQECFKRRWEYRLNDSTFYFLSNLERIGSPDYLPTEQDILQARIPTTGINDYPISMESVTFRIIDVGGQRSERRKWIHCFDKVTCIIFLAAINEYDQILFESTKNENCLEESRALFKTIVSYPGFNESSVMLFLNKKDLFEERIKSAHLKDYFPEYEGPLRDPLPAKDFILKMFTTPAPANGNIIYSHFTCATDTENIRIVFAVVKDTILDLHLRQYNLI